MTKQTPRKRVVVTGMGMVSPAGMNTQENWNCVLEGQSNAKKVTHYDIGEMPTQIAYQIEGFKPDPRLVEKLDMKLASDFTQYGLNAALEALDQAGYNVSDSSYPEMGICMGTGMGSPSFDWYSKIYVDQNFESDDVVDSYKHLPARLTQYLKQLTGARGPAKTVHTACASSGQSLGEAFEMISEGEAKVVLTGGADSMVNPFHMAGFCLLGALSQRNDDPKTASRPFDENRNGFVLGEGAAMLVFEEYEHAKARGANILAEVCGYGITESAYRITDLHPEGRGPIEAMQMAVDDAGVSAAEVRYINAHGTSTLLNDRIESFAVSKVFGNTAFVSSTKSITGHMISAAGAIEFGFAILSILNQTLPPSTNLFKKDQQCPIETTPSSPTEKEIKYALSNSVGFGGSNTALVAGRV